MRSLFVALVLASTVAGPAVADVGSRTTVEARVVLHDSLAREVPVFLEVETGATAGEPLRFDAVAPGTTSLVGLPGCPPSLRAVAAGFWSPPTAIDCERRGAVTVHLWPGVRARGRLRVPRGHDLPSSLGVRLRAQSVPALAEWTETTVEVDEKGRFATTLPSLDGVDLRLRAAGFASRFFWQADLDTAGPYDLGQLDLRPGASVIGRVEVPAGLDVGEVTLVLAPATGSPYGDDGDDGVGRLARSSEQQPDDGGFFSFEGLAAGAYGLLANHPRLTAHEVSPIQVVGGAQTEIAEPLLLVPAARLTLVVVPPFDPYGEEWRLRWVREQMPGRWQPAGEGTAGAGTLDTPAEPGRYLFRVLDSRGTELASRQIDASGDALHTIEVEAILVEGTVTLGDEPLAAEVRFRGEAKVRFDTDADGRFGGYLPPAEAWQVTVESTSPSLERHWNRFVVEADDDGTAVVDLRIPDTRVAGLVTDEAGTPRVGASVEVTDPVLAGRPTTAVSDAEGRFELLGLDAGTYRAQAVDRDADGQSWSSNAERVSVEPDRTSELRLVLRREVELSGRVVDPAGNALGGVWIEILPYDAAGVADLANAEPLTADGAGRFAVSLPATTGQVQITLMAPGFAWTQRFVEPGAVGDLVVGGEGGTLVVDLAEPVAWDDPAAPRPALVDAAGGKFHLGTLAQWAELNGVEADLGGERLTVPMLAPGRYAVCWLEPADWVLRQATGNGCVGGEVNAGGSFVVRLPAPR